MEAKEIAQRIALICKSKKAQKVIILDVRKFCGFCDYFVIAGATSLRQVSAVAQGIQEDLAKHRIRPFSKPPAQEESGWVALDYGGVIAHLFYKPMREFYSLERLWSDAKKVRISSKL